MKLIIFCHITLLDFKRKYVSHLHLYVERRVFSFLFLAKTEWTGQWIQLVETLKQWKFFLTSGEKAVTVKSWFSISTSCTSKCPADELLFTVFETLVATMYYWNTV